MPLGLLPCSRNLTQYKIRKKEKEKKCFTQFRILDASKLFHINEVLCIPLSHIFREQLLEILNMFNTLTLEQIFRKTKTFPKSWSAVFYLKVLRLKAQHFHKKLSCQKPMLRQIKLEVQNEAIAKTRALPLNTLIFLRKFCFSLRTPL